MRPQQHVSFVILFILCRHFASGQEPADDRASTIVSGRPHEPSGGASSGLDIKPSLGELLGRIAAPTLPLDDAAFHRFFDVLQFVEAVRAGDAEVALDLALQLAHGEKVLLRKHRGLSSSEALEVVLTVAVERRNDKALDRLARAAEQLGLDGITQRIEARRKLDQQSRSDSRIIIDLAQADQFDFHLVKSLIEEAHIARMTGDAARAQRLVEHIQRFESLTPQVKEQLVAMCRPIAEQTDDHMRGDLLSRLMRTSRSDGLEGEWDSWYMAANGQRIKARLQIAAGRGTYSTPGCKGQLFNIQSSEPFGGGPTIVSGRWRFCNGATGLFQWSLYGDSFNGHWSFEGDEAAHQWNGVRIGAGGTGGGGDIVGGDVDGGNLDGGNLDGGGDLAGGDLDGGDLSGGGWSEGDDDLNGNGWTSGGNMGSADGLNGGGEPGGLAGLLGGTWQSNNGSNCTIASNGGVTLSDPNTGIIYTGKLQMRSGRAVAYFQEGPRYVPYQVKVLNRTRIQIGNRVYVRRR